MPVPDCRMVLIGVGSNLQPERCVPRALRLLRECFGTVRVSTFYWTKPLRGLNQPPYVNGVVAVSSDQAPASLRDLLGSIEYQCGRVRDAAERYASRTLDLDLLACGDEAMPLEDLPAADLLERDFCLVPAAELLPDWVHPTLGRPLRAIAGERFPAWVNILEPVAFPLSDGGQIIGA